MAHRPHTLSNHWGLALAAILALTISSDAQAVSIFSHAGGGSCTLGAMLGGGACTTQQIGPHSAWQTDDPHGNGAVWVSYADTGIDGSTVAPRAGSLLNPDGMNVIMTIEETFTFGPQGGHLDIWIWADDTARVFLDGDLWIAPNFTQGTCAASAIGCEPGEYGELITDLGEGTHTLRLDLFQTGSGNTNPSNPFGVLYSGEAVSSPIPEPSAALAFGTGLIFTGLSMRRRRS